MNISQQFGMYKKKDFMAGCHKNSMNIILRYLNAVSQSNVKIDTCKVSHLARLNPERWHFHF